jgi:hypothetical protein
MSTDPRPRRGRRKARAGDQGAAVEGGQREEAGEVDLAREHEEDDGEVLLLDAQVDGPQVDLSEVHRAQVHHAHDGAQVVDEQAGEGVQGLTRLGRLSP